MTQQQAFDELDSIFLAAKSLLPGEWTDMFAVRPCSLPSGRKGLYYEMTFLGTGMAPEKQERVFMAVNEAMTGAGLKTTKGVVPGRVEDPITQLSTERTIDRIQFVHFRLATRTAVFDADSRCVAGDADAPIVVSHSEHPTIFPDRE